MPTRDTMPERVERARRLGTYEHLRQQLEHLAARGYSRHEISEETRIGESTLDVVLSALRISTTGLAGRKTKQRVRIQMLDADTLHYWAVQRAEEQRVIMLCRETYGVVGRGW